LSLDCLKSFYFGQNVDKSDLLALKVDFICVTSVTNWIIL